MNEVYKAALTTLTSAGDCLRTARANIDAGAFEDDDDKTQAREFSDELTKIMARVTKLNESVRKAGLK